MCVQVCTCIWVCMYMQMCVGIYVWGGCMCVCMYMWGCMHVCIYICAGVCVCVCDETMSDSATIGSYSQQCDNCDHQLNWLMSSYQVIGIYYMYSIYVQCTTYFIASMMLCLVGVI